MRVTFGELVKRNVWEDVRQSLSVIHKGNESVSKYKDVFNTLLSLTPVKKEEDFYIQITVNKNSETGEVEFDVSGYNANSQNLYSIALRDWAEWLSYYIREEDLKGISEADYIAYCLWEMTFYGYSHAEVQEHSKQISMIADAIEANNVTEKKETCPLCDGTKKVFFDKNMTCTICDEEGKVTYLQVATA